MQPKEEIYKTVTEYFQKNMPDAKTELNYENDFQLLVAVMLSAQCTDKRVNLITPSLFDKYPTPKAMAEAGEEKILECIKSVSYPNSKANHLYKTAKILAEKYNSILPKSINELTTLPGVGIKTANVVASVLWGEEVMPVDTHVFRVSARLGLTENAKTPIQAEKQLESGFEKHIIPRAHHWLILHGRNVCKAIKPKCNICGLTNVCNYFNINNLQ